MELKLPQQMPLDLDKSGSELETITKDKIEKLNAYEKRVERNISRLIAFLNKNKDWIQAAPARGDIGAESFIKGKGKQIWLIDWEFATRTNMNFYDVSYFQYRLFVDIGKPRWANEFMKAFRKIHRFTQKDEQTLRWMNAYRLVGGYNEADKRPELFERVKKWEELVMKFV